jgi:porin
VNVDGQKAGLWQGLLINLHGETVYGDSVNNKTGALLPVNTGRAVPIPDGTVTCLTAVQVTQALSENFAVVAGKINTFDSFQQPFMPGKGVDAGFMNMGLFYNTVLARTIPYSTLGAGAVLLVDGQPAGGIFVFDTNNTPTTSGFDTFFDNGVTIYVQGGLPSNFFGMPGQHIFSGTYSTGKYAETDVEPETLIRNLLSGLPLLPKKSGSWALTYTGSQTLWTDPGDKKRSWGAFGCVGISDGNPNPIHWSAYGGVAGSSPIAGRQLDSFGIGYFYVGISDGLKDLAPRLVPIRDEHGVELFYNVAITPWCHVTPDLQVVTPARDRVDAALVFGIRAKLDF